MRMTMVTAVVLWQWLTASLPSAALISALKQAGVRFAHAAGFTGSLAVRLRSLGRAARADIFVMIVITRPTVPDVVVLRVQTELWLDGGRVDAVLVEAVSDRLGELHVPCRALILEVKPDLDVQTTDEFRIAELPYMNVMAANDSREILNIIFDVVDVDADRYSLEQNPRSGFA